MSGALLGSRDREDRPTKGEVMSPASDLLDRAARLTAEQRHEEALAACEKACALEPWSGAAALRASVVAEALGRAALSLAWADEALVRERDLPGVQRARGNALVRMGLHAEARAAYELALAQEPACADTLFCAARGALVAGKHDDALELARNALRIAPKAADAHTVAGHALSALGRPAEAIHPFRTAAELAPTAERWKHCGNAYLAMRQYGRAEEAYEEAINLDPDSAALWNNLGSARSFRGRWEAALNALQRALQLEPDSALALANTGNVWRKIGDASKARKLLRKALACDPKRTDIWLDLARNELGAGNLDAAEGSPGACSASRPRTG